MERQNNQSNIPSATDASQETIFNDLVDTTRLERNLKNARGWLYVIAAMQTILAIIEYSSIADKELATAAGLIGIGMAAIFFVLALLSVKHPFPAFITALVIYVIVSVATLIVNPTSISIFYVVKIIVVIALVKAITSAKELAKLKESIGVI